MCYEFNLPYTRDQNSPSDFPRSASIDCSMRNELTLAGSDKFETFSAELILLFSSIFSDDLCSSGLSFSLSSAGTGLKNIRRIINNKNLLNFILCQSNFVGFKFSLYSYVFKITGVILAFCIRKQYNVNQIFFEELWIGQLPC